MTYRIRVTTTVEQIDFDGRVLFKVTDSIDKSSIDEVRNRVDVPAAFTSGTTELNRRILNVLGTQYEHYV